MDIIDKIDKEIYKFYEANHTKPKVILLNSNNFFLFQKNLDSLGCYPAKPYHLEYSGFEVLEAAIDNIRVY